MYYFCIYMVNTEQPNNESYEQHKKATLAWQEYDKVHDLAWQKYEKVRDAALREYRKACDAVCKHEEE